MNKSLIYSLFLFLAFSTTAVKSQQLDDSFHSPVALRASSITSLVTQPDGKILLGGEIAYHGNKPVNNLIRIAPNGSLDATFVSAVPYGYTVDKIVLTASGKIALVLTHASQTGYTCTIALLNSEGGLIAQTESLPYRQALASLPDGTFLIGGNKSSSGLKRLNADLSTDLSFNVTVNGDITDIQVHGDKIFVSGTFNVVNGITKNDIVKLNLDGSIDNTFDTGSGTSDRIGAITILPDGKVLPGVTFLNGFNGVTLRGWTRLNADGSVDGSFMQFPNFRGAINRVQVINDQLYVAAFTNINGVTTDLLQRFNQDGSLDGTFSPVAFKNFVSYNVHVIAAGNDLIISGPTKLGNMYGIIKTDDQGNVNADFQPRIARLGELRFGDRVNDKMMVAGDFFRIDSLNTFGMARLLLDGTVDDTFVINDDYGSVQQLRLLSDGTTYVSTYSNFFKVDKGGTKIESFHWEKRPPLYQVIKFDLMEDGRIIVADPNTLARLNSDGSYDESFEMGHTSSSTAFDFDLQGDDVIYGFSPSTDDVSLFGVSKVRRVKPDAVFDVDFSAASPEKSGSLQHTAVDLVYVLKNGEILIGGAFQQYGGLTVTHGLVKLSKDGVPDETFNNHQLEADGPGSFFDAAAEQIGDKIFIKTRYALYSINVDGTANAFELPTGIETISDLVAVPSEEPESSSGRLAVIEDKLIAIGSFYDVQSKSRGSMIRLSLPRATEPTEPGVVTSVENRDKILGLELFPNPTSDRLYVRASDESTELRIDVFCSTGPKIEHRKLSVNAGNESILDVSDLPPGLYTIRVMSATGKTAVSKFVRRP